MMSMQGPSPAVFFDAICSYQRTEALRAGIELDLFTQIGMGKRTAVEIAAATNAAPRGIRILADYLTIAGLLTKKDDQYSLTPDSAAFLDRKSPMYLGGTIEFLLTPSLRECFSKLTEAVRRGGTAVSDDGTVSHDNPIWVPFARAMGPLMRLPAKLLADLIPGDTNRPLQVLDVAAGHGLFGIAVAARFPKTQVTALDWPNVLAVAAENAQHVGLGDRHRLLKGSAFEIPWRGPYDVVLFTNFLHHFDIPNCEELAKNAFAALAPGGLAITLDFIPEPDRITPPSTAGFALTMLATTKAGDAFTFAEYEEIFNKAGFAKSEFHPLPPTTQQVVVSTKR